MASIQVDKVLEGLNPQQREAVLHHEGPLLVLAGPGSGKTRVITHRLAYLMTQGVRPSHLLALTFTNKAAGEMRRRVEQLVGHSGVLVATFHGFCARLLRWYASLAGLQENFSIYDRDDSVSLVKQIIKQGGSKFEGMRAAEVLAAISNCKQALWTPEEYQQHCQQDFSGDMLLGEIYADYQQRLQLSNAVDFDDLLFHVARLLAENSTLRARLDARFQFILVDEYQDTNSAQFQIVRHLAGDYPHIMATGDPDQSIYGWRGATIQNILDFRRHYPGAKQIRLEQNYRSTPNILRVADHLISYNSQRLEKTLRTDRAEGRPIRLIRFPEGSDEADAIAGKIATAIETGRRRPRDFAVFYRTNYLSRSIEQSLRRYRIPYQIVRGTEFYQRMEIKTMVAYLQLIHNPEHDEAFKRVVNVPARAIGKTTVNRLIQFATDKRLSLMEAARRAEQIDSLGKRARGALLQFVALIDGLSRCGTEEVHELLREVAGRTGYLAKFEESGSEEDTARAENIHELIEDASQFDAEYQAEIEESSPLEAFLQNVALTSDQDGMRDKEDVVSLMTLHAAKGLEFPEVFIVAVEEGVLPHARSRDTDVAAVEEERRLLFVGITRAMDELQISFTRHRGFGGWDRDAVPSSFLRELPLEELERHGIDMHFSRADEEDEFALADEFASRDEFAQADEIPAADESTFEDDAEFEDDADEWEPEPERKSKRPVSRGGVIPASRMDGASAADDRLPVDEVDLGRGTIVTHPEHGVGTVVGGGGSGRNATVEIRFAGESSTRSFRVAFAPLTVVRSGRKELDGE